jgi:hypothetical protein
MMAVHAQLLQNLVQVVAGMQQQQQAAPAARAPSGLRDFLSTQPPTFSHATEPLEADDWLLTIERKLDISRCAGEDKVRFASHQLMGPAAEWWTSLTAAHANAAGITWEQFKEHFRGHFVPTAETKIKRREFLALKQGSMTVRQYLTKFTQLARYAPEDVSTDEKKQDCFREGLNADLQYALTSCDFTSFQKLVEKATLAEKKAREMEEERKRKATHHGQSSSNVRPRYNPPMSGQMYRPAGSQYMQRPPAPQY